MEATTGTVQQTAAQTFASAVGGDEPAFARIVAAYDDEMYRVCVAVCRDQAVAADAVQAAWAIAWRKLDTVREPERLRPWLVAIAVNEAKTLLKKRSRRSRHEMVFETDETPGGRDPAAAIASVDLRTALEGLDPDDRALLAMRYVAGFNASELASALGASPAAVRQRLKRLVDRLRGELE